jgi:uncharacterized protein
MISNSIKTEWSQAAAIVRDAGGRIVGRTRLQKVAYLMEIVGFGSGFRFEYKHYGPYSERLSDAVAMANAFGFLEEEERGTEWGGTYSIYFYRDSPAGAPNDDRVIFVKRAAEIDAICLELAATAAYLKLEAGSKTPWEDTKKLKPEKATKERITLAKLAYAELRKLATPESLPPI